MMDKFRWPSAVLRSVAAAECALFARGNRGCDGCRYEGGEHYDCPAPAVTAARRYVDDPTPENRVACLEAETALGSTGLSDGCTNFLWIRRTLAALLVAAPEPWLYSDAYTSEMHCQDAIQAAAVVVTEAIGGK